jgi:hypothetical protein
VASTSIRKMSGDLRRSETPLLSLDDYCDSHPGLEPACIKLDIEGSEYLALQAPASFLHGRSPIWLSRHTAARGLASGGVSSQCVRNSSSLDTLCSICNAAS